MNKQAIVSSLSKSYGKWEIYFLIVKIDYLMFAFYIFSSDPMMLTTFFTCFCRGVLKQREQNLSNKELVHGI